MSIEYINLYDRKKSDQNCGLTHGTLCAAVLDHCTSGFELINIQILPTVQNRVNPPRGSAERLAEALQLCKDMQVDIVSLSAVTSQLSDSRYIYDAALALSKSAVIVSSLDNARHITIPASYPFVFGVQSDRRAGF